MKKSLREKVLTYVQQKYAISADYPWARYPNYAILRHSDNKKWFALIGDVEMILLIY